MNYFNRIPMASGGSLACCLRYSGTSSSNCGRIAGEKPICVIDRHGSLDSYDFAAARERGGGERFHKERILP
jgi:hypothetical protein